MKKLRDGGGLSEFDLKLLCIIANCFVVVLNPICALFDGIMGK